MLINFYKFYGKKYLSAKIFFKIVPFRLYGRVAKNTFYRWLKLSIPSSAILGMTYQCQCQCIHCSAGSYKNEVSKELSKSEWIKLLQSIYKMGIPRINLSGGEALLKENIFDIIQYASKKFVTILESNGLFITDEIAAKLKKANISCVAISIDSVRADEHDSLRNVSGCFQKALKAIERLNKIGIPCIMSTYIPRERANQEYIEQLMGLAQKLNIMALRILPPRPVGSFSCHVDSLLTKEQEQLIKNFSNPFISYYIGMPAPTECGIFSNATFYVSPYGDIQPCPFMPISFGTIKEEPLCTLTDKMWKHKIFHNEGKSCLVFNESFRKKHLESIDNFPRVIH